MTRYASATSKAEATARAYLLAEQDVEALGPGSKEKKSSLVALGRAIGLDLSQVAGKTTCGERIAHELDVVWDGACCSRGDTITLVGLNRLVDAAVDRLFIQQRHPRLLLGAVLVEAASAAQAMGKISRRGNNMQQVSSELEQTIAEHLATLSEPGPVPDGAAIPTDTQYAVEEIRVADGSWRAVVERQQGWLHLPSTVVGETPDDFDRALDRVLPGAAPGNAAVGLMDRLAARLERAVDLRERFLASLEGSAEGRATLGTASQEWFDGWEEVEDEEEVEVGGPIMARADVWSITDFVQKAEDGELNLSPSYQRADVWPTGDAQQLIESVLRGIPLPSIILLQEDGEQGSTVEVIDGKQRLTSILRFLGRHPRAVELVRRKATEWGEPELLSLFQRDFPAFKKKWKAKESTRLSTQVERELYFPYPLRVKGSAVNAEIAAMDGKYYSEVRELLVDVVGRRQRVRSIFEQTSAYRVPVILYEEVSTEQIHEVFSLYNKQGKHLNAEEIRNARFHGLSLMRALLATAGDAEDIKAVAPFLVEDLEDLASTAVTLDSPQYGFGRAGYKRTKLLSWVAAVLFADGSVGSRSTAATVNALLKRVSENKGDALRDDAVVRQAMLLLDHGLDAHAAVPQAWAATFKNPKQGAWQELQLVATLVGLSAAHVSLGEHLVDVLEERAFEVKTASQQRWRRPVKTQTLSQWQFIGGVVRELLDILGVEADDVDRRLRETYGASGLTSLVSLRAPREWEA